MLLVRHLADEPLDAGEIGPAPPLFSTADADLPTHRFAFTSNEECADCHEEIFAEWVDDQHRWAWENQPLLRQDPKLTECNNCHAPQPILEIGIEHLPRIRTDRFHEGVGCIECHRNRDRVEGPLASADAPCNPRYNPRFTESIICSSCHAPHGSLEEWRRSAWAKKGYTCQACHMPLIDAPAVTGGPRKRRRSHRMVSQRDPGVLAAALKLETEIASGRLRVSLTNVGAAHNVPGEIFNRELFLATEILDGDGHVQAKHRESFKTVRREQRASVPSTQLEPGERRTFAYDLGMEHGKIRVRVGYKLLLFFPDHQAFKVHEREIDF